MIVFAKTRHFYQSYTDFWRLAELSNFPICYVDEIDLTQHVTFITSMVNGEWQQMIEGQSVGPRNAHLILWNLERPMGWAGSVGEYGKMCRGMMYERLFDEVWVSDRRLAQETELRYVILGSHPKLAYSGEEKTFNIVHMSYNVPRRQTIYKNFKSIGPNCWPPEREKVLAASRFAVNIHQDVHPFQEPLRFALFSAAKLPILTETIFDAYPWGSDTMLFNPYDGMISRVKQLLRNDYGPWREIGKRGHDLLCDRFTFEKVVEQAIKESVGHV